MKNKKFITTYSKKGHNVSIARYSKKDDFDKAVGKDENDDEKDVSITGKNVLFQLILVLLY